MKTYATLSEAIDDLKDRGYTDDFSLRPHCLENKTRELQVHPDHFKVDQFYHFEGMTDPDKDSVLFAISAREGMKGLLVDAYGAYAENLTPEMSLRLKLKHEV